MSTFVRPEARSVTPVEKPCAKNVDDFERAMETRARSGIDASGRVRRCASPLDAYVVGNVCEAEECVRLTRAATAAGYTFWHGDAANAAFRNADTVEVRSTAIASELWERLRPHVTSEIEITCDETHGAGARGKWVATGVNEHLLFNRYASRGHFSPHTDGATVVDFNTRSFYSVLIYLNDCDEGGETVMFAPPKGAERCQFIRDDAERFRWPREWIVDAAPCEQGSALVFRQDIPHEGAPVGEGSIKLLIRTDVMYSRQPPAFADAVGLEAYALHQRAMEAESNGDAMEAMRLFRFCRRLCPDYADFVGI